MRQVVFLFFIFTVASLTGCRSTQYVDRVVNHVVHQTDTLHQYDSIYVNNLVQVFRDGDTIFKVKEKTLYKLKYVYKAKTDTLMRDSIVYISIPEVKEVEKPLSWWQKTQMIIGDSFLLLFLVMLIFGIVKSIKFKKNG